MAATQDDIRGWLMKGKLDEATHVIVVCDTFDWEDYPVYVQPAEDVALRVAEIGKTAMQRVMEVYDLALPFYPQLNEVRSWHLSTKETS